jgi:hypothetical protein
VKSRERPNRQMADGRAEGNEGRKEVECMRSIACKRGEERDDRKRVQVVIWREGEEGERRDGG